MPSDRISDYLAYRTTVKRLLITSGLWPSKKRDWYHFLTIIPLTLNIIMAIVTAGFVKKHINNLKRAILGGNSCVSMLGSIFKIIIFIVNRKDIEKLHEMLDTQISPLLCDTLISKMLLTKFKGFEILRKTIFLTMCYSCFLYTTRPIVNIVLQHLHDEKKIRYLLVMPGIYPFTIVPNGHLYRFIYALESISVIYAFTITCGIDLLFNLYIFQMVSQFREMSHRIAQIDVKNDCKQIVQECITKHEILIECRNILEKIYGPIIMWTILVNGANICSQMVHIAKFSEMTLLKTNYATSYISYKLFQTLVYSWGGSQLTEAVINKKFKNIEMFVEFCCFIQSENYDAAVYTCNWNGNKDLMSSMVIMLGQKPLILNACGFTTVSINLFIKVANTAISYLFLLQTLQEKEKD
uniref:Odorant receptor n=1 Tax=Aulacocentrum confusum TaxID=2767324 RepID=A0A7G8Z932_9HYME|nr:olfactory receptor 13 [Aulacocentrum confusum]